MIGAFAAFGVNFDLAVLAVLSYRAISFWLPTIPGAIGLPAAASHGRALARGRGRAADARTAVGTAGALQGSEHAAARRCPARLDYQ